jgi:hypothetical protein
MAQLVVAAGSHTPAYTAVNNGDTISGDDIGDRGVILHVKTAGTPTNVTVSDPLKTPAGNAGTPVATAIGATAEAKIFVGPKNVDPATRVATINYSSVTAATAQASRY